MKESSINVMYDHELEEATSTLAKGGTILFPTDTIWGIGCDACNEKAIQKVYELKELDPSNPLILLVDSLEMLKEYVKHVHPKIETLLAFHERPLTVVYEQAKNLPKNVIAADGSIGIRIPQDEYCRYLIRAFGKPIVATAATLSEAPFPSCFSEIHPKLRSKVDFITNHRQNEDGLNDPSVIVKLSKRGELVFLRE